jgi:hypothetical protein
LTEAEAAGQSFWTKDVPQPARYRLWYAIRDACGHILILEELATVARDLILNDEGLPFLAGMGVVPLTDLEHYVITCEDEMIPTVLEAAYAGFAAVRAHRTMPNNLNEFEAAINVILNEHRISYELVQGTAIDFESKEMHQNVVVPTLHLLAGRSDLAAVETAYQHSLEEISDHEFADAVTDSGTALQEMLKARGSQGNQLDPLAKSALAMGLITGYDVKLVDWVAADRSTKGDTHNAQPATRDDAWLAVHIVGALILRLAAPTARLS